MQPSVLSVISVNTAKFGRGDMPDRTDVLVRMPPELLAEIERRTIADKKARGLNWRRNDDITTLLRVALDLLDAVQARIERMPTEGYRGDPSALFTERKTSRSLSTPASRRAVSRSSEGRD